MWRHDTAIFPLSWMIKTLAHVFAFWFSWWLRTCAMVLPQKQVQKCTSITIPCPAHLIFTSKIIISIPEITCAISLICLWEHKGRLHKSWLCICSLNPLLTVRHVMKHPYFSTFFTRELSSSMHFSCNLQKQSPSNFLTGTCWQESTIIHTFSLT